MRRSRFITRVGTLPLARYQLLATEAIFLFFFLSIWKYKVWYIGTGAAIVVSAVLAAIPALKLRGLGWDLTPLIVYFAYLYAVAGKSEYVAEARWWVAADSVGILVFTAFWIAARNNPADAIIGSFVRVSLVMAPLLILTHSPSPDAARYGGLTLPYIPSALPFIWTALVSRTRRLAATGALLVCLVVLLLSRSRAPLFSSFIVLGLATLLIGHSVRQRIKWATVLLIAMAVVGAILYSIGWTRIILFTFFARITGKDVLTADVYIRGEPTDPVRVALANLVRDNIMDAQPFGAGYMVTLKLFEKIYAEPMSLHSIYETWAFEGGVICVALVGVIFLRHLRGLTFVRRFALSPDDVMLAQSLALSTLAVLLMGLFHQMHHGPVLYGLLGLALGLRARVLAGHYPVIDRVRSASTPLPA